MQTHRRLASFESLETRRLLSAAIGKVVGESFSAVSGEGLSVGFLPQATTFKSAGGYVTGPQSGRRADLARQFFVDRAAEMGITAADAAQAVITSQYTDESTGVTHVYLQQTVDGLPVQNAVASIHFAPGGRVISADSRFVPTAADVQNRSPLPQLSKMLHPTLALRAVADALDVPYIGKLDSLSYVGGAEQKFDAASKQLSLDRIALNAQYVVTEDGLRLAWQSELRLPNHNGDWYDISVDAQTGDVLLAKNYTDHLASYDVYPFPLESPNDGPRQILTDPWDLAASPFGWQDTDGDIDPDFTDTRGNNVSAQEDVDANNTGGARPSGGAAAPLNFDFPINAAAIPSTNQNAAITNLYYANNAIHDIAYHYGFTESAGNFQVNNYGRGGVGNDSVLADALDGSGTNNANFGTPPDGQNPRMQMYVWTAANPDRTSDFDNGVIAHEYTHGISNRLTGGPANAAALDAVQSGGMGEGWSDFVALMLTQKASDTQNIGYPVGSYLNNNVNGIRRRPYSFNTAIDPLTVAAFGVGGSATLADGSTINRTTEVHATGELWASALWDMNWLLVNKYGFDGNLLTGYNASGTTAQRAGNKLALQLVLDGMKLQPANPTLADARDAILQADVVATGGANQAEIWQAFARRGMGVSFFSGINALRTDIVPAFDVPGGDPQVIGAYVQSPVVGPPASITLRFTEAVDPASFNVLNDVQSFTGPGGTDLKSQITGFSFTPDNKRLTVNFTPQTTLGAYTLTVGPNILAVDNGHAMNQDGDATSGEALDDDFTATVNYVARIGPDGGGYEAGQSTFENINLVPGAAGVFSIDVNGDDVTDSIPMGTNRFNFYGTVYGAAATDVNASSNGFISFGAVSTVAQNTDLTSPSAARIAGLWDDWTTAFDSADQVLYKFEDQNADGTNDRLIVEWNDVRRFESTASPVTFQIILQVNTGSTPGTMLVNYVDLDTGDVNYNNGASATVGLKDIGTPPTTITHRLLVAGDEPGFPWIGDGKAIRFSTDWVAPTASSAFAFNVASQRLTYTFSENVAASLSKSDLTLTNLTTGQVIPAANIAFAYTGGTNTGTFTFPGYTGGALPDGNYTATLGAAGVTDPSWLPLASDNVLNFFVLGGDANRDRTVNINDFATLAANFGQSGRTFSQGDFDYNGTVNINDFALLASKFGTTLAAAGDVARPQAVTESGATTPFSTREIPVTSDKDEMSIADEVLI